MQIIIDGDGCPVKDEVIEVGQKFQLPIILVTAISHFSQKYDAKDIKIVYVDNLKEMADYKIIELVQRGDLIITQDYGLASLCLNKATVLHHSGKEFTVDNIDELLMTRYIHQQIRKKGGHHKGHPPFSQEDRQKFKNCLEQKLKQLLNT